MTNQKKVARYPKSLHHLQKTISKYHPNLVPIICLTLLSMLTHWRWFFIPAVFSWGDVRYLAWFAESWQEFFAPPLMWTNSINGVGAPELILSMYPLLYLLFGGLVTLGIPTELVAKLVYLIPIPLSASIGSFLLVNLVTKNRWAGVIGSLVYSYNVYFLLSQSGSLPLSAGYATAPLAIYWYFQHLNQQTVKSLSIAGLVLLINASYEFRIFYILGILLLIYIGFFLFWQRKYPFKQQIKGLFAALAPFIIVGLGSLYWLLPMIQSGSLQSNAAFSRGLFGDAYMYLVQSVTFFFPWWTGGHGYANGVVQPIPIYFWLIPIAALGGMLLNLRNKQIYFWLIISLLGIFLTKQSGQPFPQVYLWLYTHIPGFNAFREASKFYVLLALGYSILIGFLVRGLYTRYWHHTYQKVLISCGLFLISALFLVNGVPVVDGRLSGLFIPRNRPSEYVVLKEKLLADTSFYRTLWIPQSSMWGFFNQNHPKIGLYWIYYELWQPSIDQSPVNKSVDLPQTYRGKMDTAILSVLQQPWADSLLDQTAIRYVIVPLADSVNEDDVFKDYGFEDRTYIINFLDSLPYLRRKDFGLYDMVVYENNQYHPHLYSTTQPETLTKVVDVQPVAFRRQNPTLYTVSLPHVASPLYLNFSEKYDPNWQVLIGNTLVPATHLKTDAGLNSFYIDPAVIKQISDAYTINPDGSLQLELKISFIPQKYVWYGLYTTGMMVCLGLGVYWFLRNKFTV